MNHPDDRNPRHSIATRWVHALLATAVIGQLATSLVMEGPRRDRPGDWLFDVHQYLGLSALAAACGFWLVVAFRRRAAGVGLLLPWLSPRRRLALRDDLARHWIAVKTLRLPAWEVDAPLAAAVHGLGLLLMTAMGITGAVYFVALYAGLQQSAVVRLDREVHELLSNVVWAYLAGHAGLALIHHHARHLSVFDMWSLGRAKPRGTSS